MQLTKIIPGLATCWGSCTSQAMASPKAKKLPGTASGWRMRLALLERQWRHPELLFIVSRLFYHMRNIFRDNAPAVPAHRLQANAGVSGTSRRPGASAGRSQRRINANSDLGRHGHEGLPLMLSVPEVAAVPGISRAGAYELVRTDGFPSPKVGSRIVVPKEKFIE